MVLLSVVLPTFNEAEHIQGLLADLLTEISQYEHEVVVVDDDSPDGTWRVVEAYAKVHPTVRLVRRTTEKGLATAVVEGFRQAKGALIVVMDSDGQHPPEVVPRMVDAALTQDADCVVGSRYAPGGNAESFARSRRVISWGAKSLAVVGLPVVRRHKVKDPMSGLFLVRKEALPDLDRLRPRGYKILLELLVKGRLRKVVEVGYAFGSRRGGESKLSMSTNLAYAMQVAGLALHDRENRRVMVFALVGLTGVLVNLAPVWYAENVAGVTGTLALTVVGIGARELAILWNFVLDDAITFRDLRAATGRGRLHRFIRFHVASLAAFVVYIGVLWALLTLGYSGVVSTLVAIAFGFLANWLSNRHWTYAAQVAEDPPDA